MLVATKTTTRLLEDLLNPSDDEVWNELDARCRPIIVGFARRLGLREEDAADVAQETLTRFLGSYRRGGYDRKQGRLRSWIMGIAKHVIADTYRSKADRRDWRGHSGLDMLADDEHLTAIWESERKLTIVARAMKEVRANSRTSKKSIQAFEAVAFHQRSPDEVANELGMTRHDVYVAKHRLTERLREIVARLTSLYDEEE